MYGDEGGSHASPTTKWSQLFGKDKTHTNTNSACVVAWEYFSPHRNLHLTPLTLMTSLGKTNLFFLRSNESLEGFVFLQEQVTLVDTLTQLVSGQVDLCMYIQGHSVLCTVCTYGVTVRMCMVHPVCVAIDIVRVCFTIVLPTKPKLLVCGGGSSVTLHLCKYLHLPLWY